MRSVLCAIALCLALAGCDDDNDGGGYSDKLIHYRGDDGKMYSKKRDLPDKYYPYTVVVLAGLIVVASLRRKVAT